MAVNYLLVCVFSVFSLKRNSLISENGCIPYTNVLLYDCVFFSGILRLFWSSFSAMRLFGDHHCHVGCCDVDAGRSVPA